MSQTMNKKLFSIKEAAERLGKAVVTVRMLARTHNIGQKIGNVYVLSEDDIKTLEQIPGPGRPKGSIKNKR